METKENQNQIVIKLDSKDKKQKLPIELLFTLAAGTVTGVAFIFGLIWGLEKLISL